MAGFDMSPWMATRTSPLSVGTRRRSHALLMDSRECDCCNWTERSSMSSSSAGIVLFTRKIKCEIVSFMRLEDALRDRQKLQFAINFAETNWCFRARNVCIVVNQLKLQNRYFIINKVYKLKLNHNQKLFELMSNLNKMHWKLFLFFIITRKLGKLSRGGYANFVLVVLVFLFVHVSPTLWRVVIATKLSKHEKVNAERIYRSQVDNSFGWIN